jgi:hypothetical protein
MRDSSCGRGVAGDGCGCAGRGGVEGRGEDGGGGGDTACFDGLGRSE